MSLLVVSAETRRRAFANMILVGMEGAERGSQEVSYFVSSCQTQSPNPVALLALVDLLALAYLRSVQPGMLVPANQWIVT